MADRDIVENPTEVPEIPELLERVVLYALDEARARFEENEGLTPFTALVVKDSIFMEEVVRPEGETSSDECFALAKHTVGGARGASAYAFCYDGYVETDEGDLDVIISEGGLPGEEEGVAIGYIYTVDEEGNVEFDEEPAYIGPCPNFMSELKDADEYTDDEIDAHFLEVPEDEIEDAE